MKREHQIEISLPEELINTTIVISFGNSHRRVVYRAPECITPDELPIILCPNKSNYAAFDEDSYLFALIWKRDCYIKRRLNDIMWIEADGSYSKIHFVDGSQTTVSYPLCSIQKGLTDCRFARIHRSSIVNLRHVTHLVGCSFRVGEHLIAIGREFRDLILQQFIFLGVRKNEHGHR